MDNEEVRKAIENEDYRSLMGLEIGVDDLEEILRENGFEETNRGADGLTYETVAENAVYSVSVLEAEKDDQSWLVTVEQENGVPIVVGVKESDR